MKNIDVITLMEWEKSGKDYFLIDVREPYEYNEQNINGKNIPLGELQFHLEEIPTDIPLVLQCHSGGRSAVACKILQSNGFEDVYNLEGGIVAYLATR